jgi:hypothetical protein
MRWRRRRAREGRRTGCRNRCRRVRVGHSPQFDCRIVGTIRCHLDRELRRRAELRRCRLRGHPTPATACHRPTDRPGEDKRALIGPIGLCRGAAATCRHAPVTRSQFRGSVQSANYLKRLADPTQLERATFAFGGPVDCASHPSPPCCFGWTMLAIPPEQPASAEAYPHAGLSKHLPGAR